MFLFKKSLEMPAPGQALPGRPRPIPMAAHHFINDHGLKGPYPEGLATAMFGMGCFWGAERKFWELGDGIYVFTPEQRKAAEASKAAYEKAIKGKGYGTITTEILDAPEFYFAEDYHQQYLAKNPAGYCGLGGTGVSCPIGTGVTV